MSYRILTKNGVDNTNIDGARNYNFNAGRRSGIVKGALNQGNFFVSSSGSNVGHTVILDTCELRLCGHRVVIDEATYWSFHDLPQTPQRYSLIAQVIVDNSENVTFDLFLQSVDTPLIQDNLDKTGTGTYQLEIGRYTQQTDGTITDVVRTADLITGGGNNDSEYIRIGTVTTNKISPELDADVDIENTINPDDNKPQTNFTFNLPTSVGTVVSVNGEEKTSINTDITPIASSENLITSGGVHDYPAVTFAESERQKSKNLFNKDNVVIGDGTYGYIPIKNVNYRYTLSLQNDRETGLETVYFGVCKDPKNINLGYSWMVREGNKSTGVSDFLIENRPYIVFYPNTQHTLDLILARFDIQLEEGSVATDYQTYNGAIVHEKEIADVEHIETIYDKTNLNLGYTTGIMGGVEITGLNLTKYKSLVITVKFSEKIGQGIVDLTNITNEPFEGNYVYKGGVSIASSTGSSLYSSDVAVNATKTSLLHKHIRYISISNGVINERNENTDYIITNIIGVLK